MFDKRDDFSFPIVNLPFWVVMFLWHYLTVFMYHNSFAIPVSVVSDDLDFDERRLFYWEIIHSFR